MRKVLGLSIGAAAILATGIVPAAAWAATTSTAAFNSPAASTPGTSVTFTVSGTGIGITAPAGPVALSNPSIGGTATGSLGVVEVTDNQGLDGGGWTATASTTPFTTGGGDAAETIPVTDVGYDPGTAADVTTTGTVTIATTDITIAGGGLTGDPTVVAATDITGDNTASWNPVISVLVPSTAVIGDYSGTITNSVT
jgi:hypothetical protein